MFEHICISLCAHTCMQWTRVDAYTLVVRELSLASATGAKTFICPPTCLTELNMDWTNDKIIKFIQAIETYPLLWDSSHNDYKNRNKKHDATQELAQSFNCDSTEVMRKWKIILAQYRREKKKIGDSKSSGCGISDIYKPKWFGYAYLNFFHGRDEPNASLNSQDEINEQLIEDIQVHTVNEDQESLQERPVEKFKVPKKRRAVDEDPRIAHALSIMDNVNNQMKAKKHDDDDIFAAAVAAKLRKIKDERTKILVQRDIDNLLYDAIIGTGKYTMTPMPSPYSDSSNSQSQGPTSSFHVRDNDYSELLRENDSELLTWRDMQQ